MTTPARKTAHMSPIEQAILDRIYKGWYFEDGGLMIDWIIEDLRTYRNDALREAAALFPCTTSKKNRCGTCYFCGKAKGDRGNNRVIQFASLSDRPHRTAPAPRCNQANVRLCSSLPAGLAKTVMFSYFAQRVTARGLHTLILAHRDELIDQISTTLTAFNVRHGFVAAGRLFDRRPAVHVGSVFTVARRLQYVPKPDIIIIDEAHHARAKTWGKVFDAFPEAWKIGVTASPIRLSGESLGDIFDDLIVGPSVNDLTSLGHLCPYRLYIPSTINTDDLHIRGGDYSRGELAQAHGISRPSPGKRSRNTRSLRVVNEPWRSVYPSPTRNMSRRSSLMPAIPRCA